MKRVQQQGKALMVALTFVGVLVTIGAVLIGSYISAANYGNRAQKDIEAVWVNNQNVLASYTAKVQEAVQVPAMYKDDLKEVITTALAARYGEGGSKATFQWLKEHNIPFNDTTYIKVQQIIESGRNEFQNQQTRLIDAKRAYETNLGYVWMGFWLKTAGYPTSDFDFNKYKPVVLADTAAIFESGVQTPLQLRK